MQIPLGLHHRFAFLSLVFVSAATVCFLEERAVAVGDSPADGFSENNS